MEERLLHSRILYRGKLVELRLDRVGLPGGGEAEREVVDHPGAVALLAVEEGERILFVRQYRHACRRVLLELPAGTLEPGEDPLACAQRELAEEVGRRAGSLQLLARFFTSPGFCSEVLHLYLARGLEPVSARQEADETLEPVVLGRAEAWRRVREGEIADAKTLLGLLYLERGVEEAAAGRGPGPAVY